MTEQEKIELKVATYIVGFGFFMSVWWIWNALGISVLAVQSANPQLSATGFSLGVIGTEILGPALLAIGFLMSGVGKLVLSFAARVVARFDGASTTPTDTSKLAKASLVSAELKKLDTRIKSLEATVDSWEAPSE